MTIIDKKQLIKDMGLSRYISTNYLDNLSEEKLELISNFAPMIASMVYKDHNTQQNSDGKEIFDQLMTLDNEKLKLISNFAPMIASMIKREYNGAKDNKGGKAIFYDLMQKDINDPNIKRRLNLILRFAPMITSMVAKDQYGGEYNFGVDIFTSSMSIDERLLVKIEAFNEDNCLKDCAKLKFDENTCLRHCGAGLMNLINNLRSNRN